MVLRAELTPEYLESVDWEAPIRSIPTKICELIGNDFINASRAAEEGGDIAKKQVLYLLGRICSLSLQPENKSIPFAPLWTFGNIRSPAITDFSDDDVGLLKLLFPYIKQNDIRARIADVIWSIQHKGNFQYAEQGVDAYLLSCEEQIFGEVYPYGIKRISRALHLAASLGRQSERYKAVIQKIDSLIVPFLPKHNSPVSELIQLLIENHEGEPQKLAQFAEVCALDAETHKNWYVAGNYWGMKAKCHRAINEGVQEQQALQRLAMTYVNIAKESINQGQGYGVAAHHIQSAIEVVRRIPGTQDQQNHLHKEMLEYQRKSIDELGMISSGPIDLTAQIEHSISVVKDKSLLDAIFALALFTRPVSRKGMESYVDEMINNSPLLALSSNILDANGRVVGRRDSFFDNSEEKKQAKEAEMFQWARYEQSALGAVIDHARRHILVEHNPSLRDMLEIVLNNPIVPSGREFVFAEGLLYGLQGDFLVALHLLLPQLENSIRHLLGTVGVITSSLNSEGIQEGFDLGKLLDMPETAKIFHEDLIFGLKGTLISRFGGNFRNRLAHGLLEYGHFFSYDAVYIWWLLLKICCMPMISQKESKDASPKE